MIEEGYDYAALAARADGLIVRVDAYEDSATVPIAPMEPLEAVYYAMSRLTDTVAPEKLVLQLTTTASVWTDGKRSPASCGNTTPANMPAPISAASWTSRSGWSGISTARPSRSGRFWPPALELIRSA